MDKAKNIVDLVMENFPIELYLPYSGHFKYELYEPIADLYYVLGENEKAAEIATQLYTKAEEELNFYKGMKISEQEEYVMEIIAVFETAYRIIDNCDLRKDQKTVTTLNNRIAPFEKYFDRYLQAYRQQQAQRLELMRQQQAMMEDSMQATIDTVEQ